jgi:hypothetical protein
MVSVFHCVVPKILFYSRKVGTEKVEQENFALPPRANIVLYAV